MKKQFLLLGFCFWHLFVFSQQMQVPKKESIQSLATLFAKAPQQKLPFGTNQLLFNFPKSWALPDMHKKKGNLVFDTLNSQYGFCDSINYANRRMKNHTNVLTKLANAKIFIDPSFEVPTSWHKKNMICKVSKINLDAAIATYLIAYEAYVDCKNCEYPIHQYGQMLVSVNGENQIVDKLYVAAERISDLGGWKRLCYIGEDKMIHLKEFTSDELEMGAGIYAQYKMLANGMFIRYYAETEASISNDYEQGLVSNHKRVGEWVDKKTCFLLPKKELDNNWVYTVSQYSDGLLDGLSTYYKLEQEYDQNGLAILSRARKGKHLFSEIYKAGELWKREFNVK